MLTSAVSFTRSSNQPSGFDSSPMWTWRQHVNWEMNKQRSGTDTFICQMKSSLRTKRTHIHCNARVGLLFWNVIDGNRLWKRMFCPNQSRIQNEQRLLMLLCCYSLSLLTLWLHLDPVKILKYTVTAEWTKVEDGMKYSLNWDSVCKVASWLWGRLVQLVPMMYHRPHAGLVCATPPVLLKLLCWRRLKL